MHAQKEGIRTKHLHTGFSDKLLPLEPLDITKCTTVSELVAAMGKTSFGGRTVGEAADLLCEMIRDKDCTIILTLAGTSKQSVSNWGTTSAHIKNALSGAVADFSKELSVVGIGFKAALEGKNLVLNLGFSHPVRFPIPEGVKIAVEKNLIRVSGSNKWLVGETAAKIRDLRRPEPYQGKGIRYKDEAVRKKAGKKAAAAAGPAAK